MKNDFSVYIPFEKKDNDEHIVGGIASSEALDSQGEIVKFDAIKKALPDYMKFANIREMHQLSAVGKAIKALPDEETKSLYIEAKVIDKAAWEKCQEGVYNGFSIGGRVLKQLDNEILDLALNEISLVDRPANPEAIFSLVKFDKGGSEMKKAESEPEIDYDSMKDTSGIYNAAHMLTLLTDLCSLYEMYFFTGKDTKQVEAAIESLKTIAVAMLSESDSEDAKKVADMLKEFDKKKALKAAPTAPVIKRDSFKEKVNFFKADAWMTDYFAEQKKVLG